MKLQKTIMKIMTCTLIGINLSLFQAFASTSDPIRITDVTLIIDSDIIIGTSDGRIHITENSDEFDVTSVEILNEEDYWISGMEPRATIYIEATDGFYFSSSSKSLFTFEGEEAHYISSKRENDGKNMAVTIRLDQLQNGDLSTIGVHWDTNNGIAMWDTNYSAQLYHIKLYRNGKELTAIRNTTETSYDFSNQLSREGDYYFDVRSVGLGSVTGEWVSSESWYLTKEEAQLINYTDNVHHNTGPAGMSQESSSSGPGGTSQVLPPQPSTQPPILSTPEGQWILDSVGWWFQNPDGSYTQNNWQVIHGSYYYFNHSGYMATGWIYWNQNWYYCGVNGALQANITTPDGYYVGSDGIWRG